MNYDPIDPLPEGNQPKPFDQLWQSTVQIYGRSFGPLVGAAALGFLLSNLIQGVWQPENAFFVLVSLLISLVPAMMAQAALTVVAWQIIQKKPADITVGYGVALSIAPKYIGMQALIFSLTFAPLLLLPLIPYVGGVLVVMVLPISLFLLTRWAIAGPAMILEQLDINQSLLVSWNLTHGKALRVFGALMAFGIALILITLIALGIAALFGGSVGAEVIMLSAAQSIATPMAAIFFLLLYLDYKRIAEAPAPPEQSEPPDPPSFIR